MAAGIRLVLTLPLRDVLRRSKFIAMWRMMARLLAVYPLSMVDGASPNWTPRHQWSRFLISQCKRSATPSTPGSRNSVFVSTPNGVDTYPLQFLLNSASAYACPAVLNSTYWLLTTHSCRVQLFDCRLLCHIESVSRCNPVVSVQPSHLLSRS